MKQRKVTALLMILLLLTSMIPSAAFAAVDPAKPATYTEGAVLKGSDGKTYQFPASEQGYIKIRYIDTATGKWKVFDGQYESGEPKRTYVIRQNGEAYRGYCIEHGVRVDSSKYLTAEEQSELIYAGLSQRELINLQLALFYGYQSGDSQEDLYNQGFKDSTYFGKHGSSYNWADWYIATQCLVWEIQQGNRSENMVRQTNSLGVDGGHYLSMLSQRPAVDIYNWMVASIKNHMKFPAAINSQSESHPKVLSLQPAEGGKEGFMCTFKDTTGLGGDYILENLKGTQLDDGQIRFDEASGNYTIIFKKMPADNVFKIQHASRGKAPEKNLLFWGWKSASSHLQTIVTGAADPVAAYVKFTAAEETPEPEEGEKPEPEYFPEFQFTVSKEDLNPGWDGDHHTGMGDAPLSASYKVYRSVNGGAEECIDCITLDEFGSPVSFYDKPWTVTADLMEVSSGETEHLADEMVHCTVSPLKTEWTADVSYRIEEERPEGRFIEPDSGQRRYTASYYAVTEDQRTCMEEPENWSDIQYTITWSDGTASGAADGMDETLIFKEDVFINDCYRGRLFLSKSNESEDVFEEEGGLGVQTISKSSRWKMYLKSGGWESHAYLRFEDEGLDKSGTRVYRAVRDTAGQDNAVSDMSVGRNGCIYIYDIPYGNYRIEEVAADDTSFVLESFDQIISEHSEDYDAHSEETDPLHEWNIRDKKKENIIKVIKTDAETGKQVRLKGTKFYIRYMGNPLLDRPADSENYGRLLPNAQNINAAKDDYTFVCNENGEIVIPYDLEFGEYRLEEWAVPEGYHVNEAGINYYTFKVDQQEGHLHGTEYTKYYQAVSMENNPVKGKIKIEKFGEILTGFTEAIRNGFSVKIPEYSMEKLKGAIFGIYAASDIAAEDGAHLPVPYDKESGNAAELSLDRFTQSGNRLEEQLTEEKSYIHKSGASVRYVRQRNQSVDNPLKMIYTTPPQVPAHCHYEYESKEDETEHRYFMDVTMEYQAGGSVHIDISARKVTKGTKPVILWPETENFVTAAGSTLDVQKNLTQKQLEDGQIEMEQSFHAVYLQSPEETEPFMLQWDGLSVNAEVKEDKGIYVLAAGPENSKSEYEAGTGFKVNRENHATAFYGEEPDAPVCFVGRDGIATEVTYSGGFTKTVLNVPLRALQTGFEHTMPSVSYGTQMLDWYTPLSPDNPETEITLQSGAVLHAERKETVNEEVSFIITLISNQKAEEDREDQVEAEYRPFVITCADGYQTEVFTSRTESGAGIGIMNITADGPSVKHPASALVETLTSGDDGTAVSSALPLGAYLVRELSAPEGYLSDPAKSMTAELNYADQFTPLVWDSVTFENEAVPVELELEKVFETGHQSGKYSPGDGAVFGIFNAEEIVFRTEGKENLLPADTCLDTFTSDSNGRGILKAKLPEGLYYLKELKTRYGYILDETHYCFQVSDDIRSNAVCLSSAPEGYDADGITLKIVMGEDGTAEIIADVLKSYPEKIINAEQAERVNILKEQDRTRYLITASETVPAEVLMPDGSLLTVNVMENGFSYSWGEEHGVYVPEIAYTGYYAECELQFESEAVLYSAGRKEGICVKHTEIDGEPVIECTVFKGDYGDSTEETVFLKGGETWKKAYNGTVFQAETDFKGQVKLRASGCADGWLETSDDPELLVDGILTEGKLQLTKCSTLTRQDSDSDVIQIKINTKDGFILNPLKNDAEERNWPPEEPESEEPEEPAPEEPEDEPQDEPEEPKEDRPEEPSQEIRVPKTADGSGIYGYLLLVILCLTAGITAWFAERKMKM